MSQQINLMRQRYDQFQQMSFGEMNEAYLRALYPEEWAAIDSRREDDLQRARDAAYLDPYMQATGEFLEYVCARPLPNPLTGDTV